MLYSGRHVSNEVSFTLRRKEMKIMNKTIAKGNVLFGKKKVNVEGFFSTKGSIFMARVGHSSIF